MKTLRYLPLLLLLLVLAAPQALGYHVPPWDSGHNSFTPDPGDQNPGPGTGNGCNSCPCTSKTQSPVEVASGNFIYSMRPLLISGLGPAIDFTLTYNSQDLRRGPFGAGWVHPYEQRIIEATDEVSIYAICTQANGKRERFSRNPDGSYTSPPHVYSKLTKNSDGTFTLRDKYGMVRRFSQQGLLASIVDRNGNTLTFSYDLAGFMTHITDAAGRSVTLTKGSDGRVASLTDPANRIFRFGYDASGNLTRYTNPLGNNTTYQYDSTNNLTALIDPRNNTLMRVVYDNQGRVSQHVDGAETWTYAYTPSLKRTTKRDSQNRTWTFDYNDNGNVIKIADPLNKTELYTLDASLNVTQFTDKNGNTTKYTYDNIGNQLTISDTLNNTRAITYEPVFNRPLSIRDTLGNISNLEYDARGNLIKFANAMGHATQLQYGTRGQLNRITDALGNSSTFAYDINGNLIQIVDPLGNAGTASFDILGNILSETDAEGRTTQFYYDANERLVRVSNTTGGSTINEYDNSDNLATITIPSGAKTTFLYDSLNRLIRVTNSLGQSTSYSYDRRNNVASKSDAKGQNITFSYDVLNRLIRKTKSGDSVSYTYDAVGNLLNIIDGDSNLTAVYDAMNRMTEARTAATSGQPATTIRYSYDAAGNRLTMSDPAGGVTNYSYDSLLRLTSLSDPIGQQFTFTFDALSRRTRVSKPLGFITTYTYDAASRLISLIHQGGPSQLPFTYTYDRVGNRLLKTDSDGLHSYNYDSLDRLTAAVSPNPTITESYSYDSVGNRVSSHLSTSHTLDSANRLNTDTTFDYLYDANGNLSRKTERATNRTTSYTYDSEDLLIRIDFPDRTSATYRYDGLGRRIEKNINGQITRYIYDGEDILFEYSGTTFAARYTHGPGIDEALAVSRGAVTTFLQTDAIGSVIREVDAGGIKASYNYDSFGRIISQTGTRRHPYGFQGREFDAESGFYYFRARYYDPQTGRFVNEDPIDFLNGDNFYRFAKDNPLKYSDPNGLDDAKIGGNRIRVHNNDPDPWPSRPHGHIYDNNQVVDAEGNIYDKSTRKKIGKLTKKQIIVWKKFLGRCVKIVTVITIFQAISSGNAEAAEDAISDLFWPFSEIFAPTELNVGEDEYLRSILNERNGPSSCEGNCPIGK